MKFHMLVLEGDKEAEKKKEHLPVYTKQEYLRRKWREDRPPLHNRSFYLCRMIEEELKGVDLDGSGKITICAHRNRLVPGREKYICDEKFHVSIYYLEQAEIRQIEEADKDTEPMVVLEILRNALLDIARRNQGSEDTAEKIERAFEGIISHHFVREERIDKLTKRSRSTGLTAHVYRVLSAEVGEGWYLKMTDRKGNILSQETMGGDIRYVDRLNSRLYAKSAWRGNTFVMLERFGREVFSISVPYLHRETGKRPQ